MYIMKISSQRYFVVQHVLLVLAAIFLFFFPLFMFSLNQLPSFVFADDQLRILLWFIWCFGCSGQHNWCSSGQAEAWVLGASVTGSSPGLMSSPSLISCFLENYKISILNTNKIFQIHPRETHISQIWGFNPETCFENNKKKQKKTFKLSLLNKIN